MERRSRYPVVFGVLIGLLLPLLYLVQLAVQRTPDRQQWLAGELKVVLEAQAPMTWSISLKSEGTEPGPLQLMGSSHLRQADYPWDTVPFEASLSLAMEPAFFAGGDASTWAASYTERLISREDGLGLPPIPCDGELSLLKEGRMAEDLTKLQSWTKMELDLNLLCVSAGPDLLWNSGDEQRWTIRGPLFLRNRPI